MNKDSLNTLNESVLLNTKVTKINSTKSIPSNFALKNHNRSSSVDHIINKNNLYKKVVKDNDYKLSDENIDCGNVSKLSYQSCNTNFNQSCHIKSQKAFHTNCDLYDSISSLSLSDEFVQTLDKISEIEDCEKKKKTNINFIKTKNKPRNKNVSIQKQFDIKNSNIINQKKLYKTSSQLKLLSSSSSNLTEISIIKEKNTKKTIENFDISSNENTIFSRVKAPFKDESLFLNYSLIILVMVTLFDKNGDNFKIKLTLLELIAYIDERVVFM